MAARVQSEIRLPVVRGGRCQARVPDSLQHYLPVRRQIHVKPSFEEVKSACNERAPGAESEDIVHWTDGMIDTIGQVHITR